MLNLTAAYAVRDGREPIKSQQAQPDQSTMIQHRHTPLADPRRDPRFLKALQSLEEAFNAQRLGRNEEADRLYAKLVKKHPDYFDALNLYGLFNYHQGKYQAAFNL